MFPTPLFKFVGKKGLFKFRIGKGPCSEFLVPVKGDVYAPEFMLFFFGQSNLKVNCEEGNGIYPLMHCFTERYVGFIKHCIRDYKLVFPDNSREGLLYRAIFKVLFNGELSSSEVAVLKKFGVEVGDRIRLFKEMINLLVNIYFTRVDNQFMIHKLKELSYKGVSFIVWDYYPQRNIGTKFVTQGLPGNVFVSVLNGKAVYFNMLGEVLGVESLGVSQPSYYVVPLEFTDEFIEEFREGNKVYVSNVAIDPVRRVLIFDPYWSLGREHFHRVGVRDFDSVDGLVFQVPFDKLKPLKSHDDEIRLAYSMNEGVVELVLKIGEVTGRKLLEFMSNVV